MSNIKQQPGSLMSKIINFTQKLNYEDIPPAVVDHTKLVVLDTLGAILAASNPRYNAGKILVDFIKQLGGNEESSIVGYNFKSSCTNAAIVNGTFGYYCDIEAHHPEAVVHPAATIIPTSLAAGESQHTDGKTFMLSFLIGTDVDCRTSLALNPRTLYDRGFHPSCVAGCIGAAAAASRILNLNFDQISRSFGLVAQQASGLLAWKDDFSENSRPFNHGIAARNGITSAYLAKLGFGAPPDIFEGRYNIFRAFSKSGESNPTVLTKELGVKFSIMDLAFKKYSCCAFLHPGLDALSNIMGKKGLKSKDIQRIVLRFPKSGTELIDGSELRSHSAQYILPVGALNQQIMIDDILYDRTVESEVKRLVENMEIIGDDDLDKFFPERYAAIVEITTKNGQKFDERVDYAAGTPENPFRQEDIEKKYFSLSQQVIDYDKAKKILKIVEKLEDVDDINILGDYLRR